MFAVSQAQGLTFSKGFMMVSALAATLLTSVDAEAARLRTALKVSAQPSSTTVYEGKSTTFTISATSSRTITYTWYKNGSIIGSNSKSLPISNASLSSAGTYSCKVTDGASTYNCSNFALTVNQIVRITQQPSSQMVNEGTGASMTVAATGTAPMSFQWYYNGQVISGATTSTLNFSSAQLVDAGTYYCQVSNPGSSANTSTASLVVMETTQTGAANISWNTPAAREDGTPLSTTDIAGYNLYHSDSDTGSMTKIASLSAADLSYVVTELNEGTHYFAATTVDINGLESKMPAPVSMNLQF